MSHVSATAGVENFRIVRIECLFEASRPGRMSRLM